MTKEELEELEELEVVDLWNDYCENNNRGGEGIRANVVYKMDEIDDVLGRMWPSDLLDTVDFNRFSPDDSYFEYNCYGYIESFNTPYDVIDVEALVKYLNEGVI